jgi:hypothetical protein
MEHQIDIARRVTGKSYQFKKTLLSGLFATLGGIVGGVSGAAIGGVGGAAAVVAAERLDRDRVAPWATFFIERDPKLPA